MTDSERDYKIARMEAMLEALSKELLGNGQPGCIATMKSSIDEHERTINKAKGANMMLAAFVTLLGGHEFLRFFHLVK